MANSENTLPLGWTTCTLREVTLPVSKIDPKEEPAQRIDYIAISSIDNVRNVVESAKSYRISDAPSRARQIVHRGDILFATVRPYLRNIARVPTKYHKQIASTGFSVLRAANGVVPGFLFYKAISRDFVDALARAQYGVSYPAVKDEQVRDKVLFLPPTAEQRRIVAKIEELFSEVDNGVTMLKTAREQLETCRQSVLKHAFEGRLTAQWREANKDKLEAPSQLLDRVNRARTERYEDQLTDWQMAVDDWKESPRLDKRPPLPAPPKALSPLLGAETERLFTLPAGWAYLRLGLLIDEPKYGTSKKCDYSFSGTGVLRIPNVVDGVINTDDLKGARFDSADMQAFSLVQGDVLMIRSNGSISIVGKSAIVSEAEEEYLYAGYLMRLRSNHDVLIPEYLLLVLGSQFMRVQIEEKAKSTSGVNNINAREVQSLVVPLCSVNEQRLIVKQLARVLAGIDAVDREIKDQMLVADALRQAILARAFSGQLVPQDPSDVPASVLLDKISDDRARAAKPTTRRPARERRAAKTAV